MAKTNTKKVAGKNKLKQQQPSNVKPLFGFVFFVMFLSVASAMAYQYLSLPGKLPLRVIEIKGDFVHLQRSDVERRVATMIDGGFFTVDMTAIRKAVVDMPWVDEVSVRRVWPDTLRMYVTEQQSIAYWGDGDLVNLDGDIFHPDFLPQFINLPRLIGQKRFAAEMVEFYLRLYAPLNDLGLLVKKLHLNQRKEWQLDFSNGLELVLGREELDSRVENFLNLYSQLQTKFEYQPKRIDMRYEHGFAVAWKDEHKAQLGQLIKPLHGES